MSNLSVFYRCDNSFHSCFYKKVKFALERLSPINILILNLRLNSPRLR